MYLGISCAFLLINGYMLAILLSIRSLWEKYIATFILALSQLIIISLTIGIIPGGYKPLPLTLSTVLIFIILLIICIIKGSFKVRERNLHDKFYFKYYILVLGLTFPIWSWEFFNGILLPPIYWDELYYHLFYPGVWARDGYIHFFGNSNPFVAGYPANLDLITGWTMATTGNDVWAELIGLPFVLLGVAVVFAFCKSMEILPKHSFWAGLLFATTPLVIFHSKSAYIDLPVSVLFGASIYFLYLYAKGGREIYIIIGAIGMGILVGAKYSALYMVIVGILPIIYRWYITRKSIFKFNWEKVILYYGIPVVILGAFFYIRNIILFGNPFYPMKFEAFGVVIFDGIYTLNAFDFIASENSWVTLIKAIIETQEEVFLDSFYGGFGPQLILLAIPAIILFLIKEKEKRNLIIITIILPVLIIVAASPAKYPRYLIFLNLLFLPFFAWMLSKFSGIYRYLLQVVVILCIVYSVIIATPLYIPEIKRIDDAAESIWSLNQVNQLFDYIDTLNEIKGDSLLLTTGGLINQSYPLLGKEWQNDVIYIEPTSEKEWLRDILDSNIDVIIFHYNGIEVPEKEWVEKNNEYFQLIYTKNLFSVYLLIPGDIDHKEFIDNVNEYLLEEEL